MLLQLPALMPSLPSCWPLHSLMAAQACCLSGEAKCIVHTYIYKGSTVSCLQLPLSYCLVLAQSILQYAVPTYVDERQQYGCCCCCASGAVRYQTCGPSAPPAALALVTVWAVPLLQSGPCWCRGMLTGCCCHGTWPQDTAAACPQVGGAMQRQLVVAIAAAMVLLVALGACG
jgi:hypothetical protein